MARQPKLTRVGRRKLKVQSPLDYTLEKAGIRYLNTEAVEAYMASMLDKLRNPPAAPGWIEVLKALVTAACCVTIAANIIEWNLIAVAIRVASLVLIPIIGAITYKYFPSPRPLACWVSYYLGTYEQLSVCRESHPKIPAEIRTRVEVIKSRLPGTKFVVYWFDKDPIIEAIHHDPKTGTNEKRYFGVWDEKGLVA